MELTYYFFLVSFLFSIIAGAITSIDFQDDLTSLSFHGRRNLTEILQQPLLQRNEVFERAIAAIQDINSGSTCSHLATQNLIHSCQSLSGPEVAVDDVKTEYSIRLAVCELRSAGATIPTSCSGFVPSQQACHRTGSGWFSKSKPSAHPDGDLCYPEISGPQQRTCLKELEARSQFWTSYSNARQSAFVICQASRTAKEKDELLHTYRQTATGYSDMYRFLSEMLPRADAFNQALEQLASKLQQELEIGAAKTRSTFEDNLDYIRTAMGSLATSFQNVFRPIMTKSSALNTSLADMEVRLTGIHQGLQSMGVDLSRSHSELVAAQELGLEALQDRTVDVYDALKINLAAARNLSGTVVEIAGVMIVLNENITDVKADIRDVKEELGDVKDNIGDISVKVRDTREELNGLKELSADLTALMGPVMQSAMMLLCCWQRIAFVGLSILALISREKKPYFLGFGTGAVWMFVASGLPLEILHLSSQPFRSSPGVDGTASLNIGLFAAIILAALAISMAMLFSARCLFFRKVSDLLLPGIEWPNEAQLPFSEGGHKSLRRRDSGIAGLGPIRPHDEAGLP